MFGGWGGWPGEGPSRGLLRDYTTPSVQFASARDHGQLGLDIAGGGDLDGGVVARPGVLHQPLHQEPAAGLALPLASTVAGPW